MQVAVGEIEDLATGRRILFVILRAWMSQFFNYLKELWMPGLLNAFSRATINLFNPRMLWLWSWPLLAAGLFWGVIGMYFWTPLSGWLLTVLPVSELQDWLEASSLQAVAEGVETMLNLIIFIILIVITSLVITAMFAMPDLVNFVAKRYYPAMVRMQGGTVVGSLRHMITALIVFIMIWAVTLPLWFVGIGLLVPLLAAAYLNQRLFCYDALSEHADQSELEQLLAADRPARWGLGFLTALLQFIPFINFFAPTLTALAFIHFELARLSQLRRQTG